MGATPSCATQQRQRRSARPRLPVLASGDARAREERRANARQYTAPGAGARDAQRISREHRRPALRRGPERGLRARPPLPASASSASPSRRRTASRSTTPRRPCSACRTAAIRRCGSTWCACRPSRRSGSISPPAGSRTSTRSGRGIHDQRFPGRDRDCQGRPVGSRPLDFPRSNKSLPPPRLLVPSHARTRQAFATGAIMIAIDTHDASARAPAGFELRRAPARAGRRNGRWWPTPPAAGRPRHRADQLGSHRLPVSAGDLPGRLRGEPRGDGSLQGRGRSGGPGRRHRRAPVRPGQLLRRARQRAGGQRQPLSRCQRRAQPNPGFPYQVSSDAWHALGMRAEGDRLAVSFDGKPLFTASDRTFSGAGKVALWTKADSLTRFDALTITTLP